MKNHGGKSSAHILIAIIVGLIEFNPCKNSWLQDIIVFTKFSFRFNRNI